VAYKKNGLLTDEKKLSTNHQSLVIRINLVKEDTAMQSLLFHLRVLRQNFPHVCHNVLQDTSLVVTNKLEQRISPSTLIFVNSQTERLSRSQTTVVTALME
jgi:hypothetical protein